MSSGLKYEQVKKRLRKKIQSEFEVGAKLPSTTELHMEMRVSPGTINRAIRDLVDEGLIHRRERRGTFVADGQKQSTTDIGFIWPSVMTSLLEDAYRGAVLHAAEQEAQNLGKHVLVGGTRDTASLHFTGQYRNKVSGVIILFNYEPAIVKTYHDEGTPVVLVDPFVRMAGVPFVTSDQYAATREATLYLAGLGHRRIVYLSVAFPFSALPVKERILGYQEAMLEVGLQGTSHVYKMAPFLAKGTDAQAEDELERREIHQFVEMLDKINPTAICCFNDITAFWVLRVCSERGIKIPEDLSLMGINDDSLAAHMWPPLTTIRLPMEEAGRVAVRLLDRLIQERRLTGGGELLPVSLVERASTAALSGQKPRSPDGHGKRQLTGNA